MLPKVWAALAIAALLASSPPDPAERLAGLHPDVGRYVRAVRVVGLERARVSPEAIYSGLVRPGGDDPRLPGDAPLSGTGARNDVVLFPAAFERDRSPGWLTLILDHEYFHARHLAHAGPAPLVDFGDASANHHFYEAAAWGWVRREAARGVYGALSEKEILEVDAAYARHREAFRDFVMKRQPAAWAHYVRFLPD